MLGLVKCLHLNLIKQSKALKKIQLFTTTQAELNTEFVFLNMFHKVTSIKLLYKDSSIFCSRNKVFFMNLSCKLVQSQIFSNRATKFVTWSLVHEAEVLSLLESLIVFGLRGPAWRVSPRGVLPRNDGRVALTPIVFSVLFCFLALFNLFFLGLWVLGAFALALVGWTSCDEYKPKKKVNYLPQCFSPRRATLLIT